jgi:hypothetical protein
MRINHPHQHVRTAKMLCLYSPDRLVEAPPTTFSLTATLFPIRDRRQFSRRAAGRRGGRRAADWRR